MSFHPRRYPALCELLGEEIVAPESRSLADEAHDLILLRIVRDEYPPSTEFKSTRLAEELGMSRTPVSQALSRLAADGILSQQRNHRATLRPGAEDWLLDLHRTRQLIEPEAARNCAGQVPEVVLSDLQLLVADAEPDSRSDWAAAARWLDQMLHLVIAECCGNLSIREILKRCWDYKRITYETGGGGSDSLLREGWLQHSAILQALSSGDGEAAAARMTDHLAEADRQRDGRIV